MGNEDIRLKKLLHDKHRFADLYNGGLFHGQKIIHPENLTLLNNENGLVLRDKDGKENSVSRYRDIVMRSDHTLLLVKLAAENQGKIHYSMPVRGMLYDAMDYTEQVRSIKKLHRERKDLKDSAEFLSGFSKEDRLLPVIPLIFYYGDETWDASLDIHDMLDIDRDGETYQKIKDFIPNYTINLVDIKRVADTDDMDCFKTDLHELFTMLKYRKDKQAFQDYIMDHRSYFKNIDTDTYEAARVLLGSDKELAPPEKGKETVNMCEALQGIYQDGLSEGMSKGLSRGLSQGRSQGISQGISQGAAQTKSEIISGMRKEGISEEVIMRITKLTKEELEEIK